MSEPSNPFTTLASTTDGLARATEAEQRRLFLHASIRGLYLASKMLTEALRALIAALPSKETP